MKHLVKISAISALLLLVASNGWAEENKSFDQHNFEEAWDRVGEIEGAFAWFNQAIQRRVGMDSNPIKYNPSERIIIFLPNEDDLEVCNFKKAKKVDKKAYIKQKNDFLIFVLLSYLFMYELFNVSNCYSSFSIIIIFSRYNY